MTDLGSRLKQTVQDQSMNLKFLQLLNSNKPIQSLKDRQILPTIPLSSFNASLLPSIHKQKTILKARTISETKIKVAGDFGNIIGTDKSKVSRKDTQYLMPSEKMILGSTKNLIKIRNKSVQSARKQAKQKQQSIGKLIISKKEQLNQQIIQINPIIMQKQVSSSQKKLVSKHITPQKIKLDFPSNKNSTGTNNTTVSKNNKLVNNKTIQEISNQAVDSLMLNIKFGKIQQNISFKSFLKKEVQPSPLQIVKKLQQWLSKYKIKSGLLMTKNLHTIFSRKSISNNLILQQFANYDQLRRQLQNTVPGLKYYGHADILKGKILAVTKIQSLFRMSLQKKYTKKLKSLMNKVKLIQRYWRVSLDYKRGRERIMQRVNGKIQKAKSLTNDLIKNWDFIKTSPKVQVHICSIALQEFKRLSIADLQQRQMAQLTRIFKCIQTDCTIVYVTPFSFSPDIMRYYQRMFTLGNKGQSFRERLYIISVFRMLERISPHLTTVSALIYDSQSLKKIKQIIKQRQSPVMGQVCSFIVPSYPSNQYLNLSAQLQIPVFSGPQSLCKLYSTKSGHYQLLKSLSDTMNQKCPFMIPKSVHGIYSEKEMINTLSVLIHKNKQINKWMFKIDDQINSRGLAYLNVDSLAFLKQLRRQEQQNIQEKLPDKQIMALIADELQAKLKLRLKILNKSIYPDYESFISHFLTRGGFIQACIQPQIKQGKTYKPSQHSISFIIEPNGQFKILVTYSRLQLGYKSINSSIQCPSFLSPLYVDNEKIIRALYRHLWAKNKLFGYFTIDMLCITQNKLNQKDSQSMNKNYVIGLDCFLNEKTSSAFIPILTSLCEYNKQKNKLIITQIQVDNKFDVKQNQSVRSLPKNSRSVTQQSLYSNLEEKSSQNKLGQQKIKQKSKQIYYIYCPFLKILNLPPMTEFFKLCKFNNLSFDIQSKTGALFLLEGGLQNGCFGFMCVANTQQSLREQALRLVQFLSKQFRGKAKNQKIGTKMKQGSDQIGQLRGYLMNALRKSKPTSSNFRRQDLNLQMIF